MTSELAKVAPLKAEIVTFTFKRIRYGSELADDYDLLDDALGAAIYEFDYGHSARQEIWVGDECVMDIDAILEASRARIYGDDMI